MRLKQAEGKGEKKIKLHQKQKSKHKGTRKV